MQWCNDIAARLQNEEINTSKIFEGALILEIVNEHPASVPYAIEWPIDMDLINDDSVIITHGTNDYPIYTLDINLSEYSEFGSIRFYIGNNLISEEYELNIYR